MSHASGRKGTIWLTGAVLTAVLAALGAAAAVLLVPARQSAETRLVVGSQALGAQQVPGYTEATRALAETYARYLNDSAHAGAQVSVRATAIAQSPVVRVEASAPTEAAAVRAADTAAQKLLREASVEVGLQQAIRSRYPAAMSALGAADAAVTAAQKRVAAGEPAARAVLEKAQIDQRLAKMRLSALDTAYQSSVVADVGPGTRLRILDRATATGSQRPRVAALGGLAGGVLALLLLGLRSVVRSSPARRPAPEVRA